MFDVILELTQGPETRMGVFTTGAIARLESHGLFGFFTPSNKNAPEARGDDR
jgi:hypothetical protein